MAWTLAMGHGLIRAGLALLAGLAARRRARPRLAGDPPGDRPGRLAGVPLVATIHATEAGRHSGWLSQPLNQQIHSVEWWLANRADALITCSAAMRAEVSHLFEVTGRSR